MRDAKETFVLSPAGSAHSPRDPFLLWQFEDFYRAVVQVRDAIDGAQPAPSTDDDSATDTPTEGDSIRKRLVSLLREQEKRVAREREAWPMKLTRKLST